MITIILPRYLINWKYIVEQRGGRTIEISPQKYNLWGGLQTRYLIK